MFARSNGSRCLGSRSFVRKAKRANYRSFVMITGGKIRISSRNTLFGSDVKLRTSVAPSSPGRTFIDTDHPLRSVQLLTFYFFAHPQSDWSVLRLQIWHPIRDTKESYSLVFERRVNVSTSTVNGSLYLVRDFCSVAGHARNVIEFIVFILKDKYWTQ